MISKPGEWAFGVQRFHSARVQLAEMTEHVLRADLDGAAAAGMEPRRTAGNDLQRLRGRPGGNEHGEGIALDVERIDRRGLGGPVAAGARVRGKRAAHAGRRHELILRLVAAEYLPDFEQSNVRKTAVGVLLCRCDQAGQQARPHVGQFGGNRIGERQLRPGRRRTARRAAWR